MGEKSKEEYDVFIAYHGTYEEGSSYGGACELTNFLKSKGLKVFFYPYSNIDAYKTSIFEVINSSTFLLTTSNGIHRLENGKIDFKYHYELCVEIDAFYSSTFLDGNNYKSPLDAKVVFYGEYNDTFKKGDESLLHELFKDRVHFSINMVEKSIVYNEIYEWVLSRIKLKKLKGGSYLSSRLSYEVQNVYSKRTAMIMGENFNDKILKSKRIICIGISNSDLTSRVDQDVLYECLLNGGSIELYFLAPNGEHTAIREAEEGFVDNRIKMTTENNLRIAVAFKNMLPDGLKNNFRLFLYDISPRLNIVFIDEYLFLQFYGFVSRGMDTPSFSIKKQDIISPLFNYCQKSYSYIKENSEEIYDV